MTKEEEDLSHLTEEQKHERRKAYSRQYNIDNADKIKANRKIYREENRELLRKKCLDRLHNTPGAKEKANKYGKKIYRERKAKMEFLEKRNIFLESKNEALKEELKELREELLNLKVYR